MESFQNQLPASSLVAPARALLANCVSMSMLRSYTSTFCAYVARAEDVTFVASSVLTKTG